MKINLTIIFSVILFSCQVQVETSQDVELSKETGNVSNSIEPEIVNVHLQPNDVILWNGIQMDTLDLHDSITTLINRSMYTSAKQLDLDSIGLVNKTNYLINLYSEKMTSYDFYKRFKDVVRSSIDFLREEKAQFIYQKSFNELSAEQQLNIKRVVEQCTIEKVSPE